ncbi:ATP-binding protein [Marivita sp. S6314]|uniref:AAA family ATPase n=1 Tax=Marivita sp. S6314 TaxID=2926406 RepID=UPI001FF661B9|nr:ATP-binding protein [Marivita sp. S6314]MCK0151378.1 ATP-binding protein [Marivita sp. S6314]
MAKDSPTLHMMCGKIASGKSTLSARLGAQPRTVVIAEDVWLHGLYADQLASVADYMRAMARFRPMIGPHIADLLTAGVSVVLDFQANTVDARRWMRGIVEQTQASHALHVLDVPDEVCLKRLHARNAAGTHPFTVSDAQFHHVSAHFVPPSDDEGFHIVRHSHGDGPMGEGA